MSLKQRYSVSIPAALGSVLGAGLMPADISWVWRIVLVAIVTAAINILQKWLEMISQQR